MSDDSLGLLHPLVLLVLTLLPFGLLLVQLFPLEAVVISSSASAIYSTAVRVDFLLGKLVVATGRPSFPAFPSEFLDQILLELAFALLCANILGSSGK